MSRRPLTPVLLRPKQTSFSPRCSMLLIDDPGDCTGLCMRTGGAMSRNEEVGPSRSIARLRPHGRRSQSGVNRSRRRPCLELLESRQLLSTYVVTNCNDSGAGSLRQAILNANADVVGGVMKPDNIYFDIPASTAANLDVPIPGFDPVTQDWTITLQNPLPTILNTVWIDGY